jgi:hypothetical protein
MLHEKRIIELQWCLASLADTFEDAQRFELEAEELAAIAAMPAEDRTPHALPSLPIYKLVSRACTCGHRGCPWIPCSHDAAVVETVISWIEESASTGRESRSLIAHLVSRSATCMGAKKVTVDPLSTHEGWQTDNSKGSAVPNMQCVDSVWRCIYRLRWHPQR